MQPAIVTEKLRKAYGRRLGIADLDLEVRPGEIFGFIGPNGAGKTTTIRLLLGLIRPTGGRAMVLGRDARRESVAVHRSIGYLPGDFGLDVRMTGRQLIRYFSRLRAADGGGNGGSAKAAEQFAPGPGKAASWPAVSEASAQDLADSLGLDLDVPMGRLSRGNRQKIALVQALYHRPPLLILDEPSTGLDPLVQDTFLQILREARDEGRTVFLSSHVLSEVERVCDRIGIVRAGRLAALETTESLLEKRRKRVSLVFAAPVDASLFAALPGVSDVWVDGSHLSLRLHDGIDAIIKLASRYTVLDMAVENPTLDEVFLSYYDEGRPWQA
jgi:ABC-2 type transport system ATP-binding protein